MNDIWLFSNQHSLSISFSNISSATNKAVETCKDIIFCLIDNIGQ